MRYLYALLAFAVCLFAAPVRGVLQASELRELQGITNTPSPVWLVQPSSQTLVIRDSSPVVFKWRGDPVFVDYYLFKIYRGYNMYAADLVLSRKCYGDVSSVSVDSTIFQDKTAYAWSVVRVLKDGRKSDPARGAFKVVRTAAKP